MAASVKEYTQAGRYSLLKQWLIDYVDLEGMMGLTRTESADGKAVTIKINGRFDFSVHQEFRAAYDGGAAQERHFVLDFANTDYIDSAACGMLLVFRDAMGGNSANISIVNANSEIVKTLSMLQFQKLFKIA